MQRKAKHALILGIVLGSVLLLTLAGLSYFAMRSRSQVQVFQQAEAAWKDGDVPRARSLYLEVLRQDTNNETATVRLAELAEYEGNWLSAVNYWNQARKLNSLKSEYGDAYLHAARMGRYFGLIANYLDKRGQSLPLEEQAMQCYCQLMAYHDRRTPLDNWQKMLQEKPEIQATPYGKLIKAVFLSREEAINDIAGVLEELSSSADYPIAQEALIARAQLERLLKHPAEEEEFLKTAQKKNDFVVTPLLANYYCHYQHFDRAAESMLPHLERFYRASTAMTVGEFMVLANNLDHLGKLREIVNSYRDRKSIVAAHYLDALQAFHQQDFNRFCGSLDLVAKEEINTPLAALMRLFADVHQNNTARLEVDYDAFQKIPPFLDFSERANALALLYIGDRLQQGDPLETLLPLVKLASQDKTGQRSFLLNSAELIDKIQKGTLTESDLQKALRAYDDKASVLAVAVSFYYFRKNYTMALEMYERLRKLDGAMPVYTRQQAIDSLIRLGRLDEARPELQQLLTEFPDDDNVRAYWRYAILYGDRQALAFLAAFPDFLQTRTKTSNATQEKRAARIAYAQHFVPFCEIALLFLDGKKEDAIAKLQPLQTDNEDLLFFKANKLRECGQLDDALALYRRISPRYSDYTYVLVNIANLLNSQDKIDEAFTVATEAWRQNPELPAVRACYAVILQKKGLWPRLLECVNPTQLSQIDTPAALRDTWIWAISEKIKQNLQEDKLGFAKDDIEKLLRIDPDNAFAKDSLKRIAARQEQLDAEKDR